jgi:hypothetical protein
VAACTRKSASLAKKDNLRLQQKEPAHALLFSIDATGGVVSLLRDAAQGNAKYYMNVYVVRGCAAGTARRRSELKVCVR